MPNFRKKPVTISAEQWFPDIPVEGVIQPHPKSMTQFEPHIDSLEGVHLVSPGDWVIVGVVGEKYACKDHIFKATYEPVDDEGAIALGWESLEDFECRRTIFLETDETLGFTPTKSEEIN